jgi:septal ring factor EnvC (AmiA/AmiB activator)
MSEEVERLKGLILSHQQEITSQQAEIKRLRTLRDVYLADLKHAEKEIERLRDALREVEGGSHPLQMVRVASEALGRPDGGVTR